MLSTPLALLFLTLGACIAYYYWYTNFNRDADIQNTPLHLDKQKHMLNSADIIFKTKSPMPTISRVRSVSVTSMVTESNLEIVQIESLHHPGFSHFVHVKRK